MCSIISCSKNQVRQAKSTDSQFTSAAQCTMSGDVLGLTDDNRALSASQLHLLLHPTEEEEDAVLRKSDKVCGLTLELEVVY